MEENLEHLEWMKGLKDTGFTIPSDYFEELDDQVRARIFLEKFPPSTNSGFIVPSNYFEQLAAEIISKTSAKVGEPAKITRLWPSGFIKYASVACFVILLAAGYMAGNKWLSQSQSAQEERFNDIVSEQVLFDIDEQVIIEHIESLNQGDPIASAEDQALEKYILDNYSQSDLASNL
ncbi:hypothetical protein [Pedobacter deserti]|uniref:hypothetical protein n=1 Tax=Pedobacter deserti TaxID=2817382 RepID=UPI00210941F6|nr:hypothetical protein [Pedobacter sp. SYSU D00382]